MENIQDQEMMTRVVPEVPYRILEDDSKDPQFYKIPYAGINSYKDGTSQCPIPNLEIPFNKGAQRKRFLWPDRPLKMSNVKDLIPKVIESVKRAPSLNKWRPPVPTGNLLLDGELTILKIKLLRYDEMLPALGNTPDMGWRDLILGTLTGFKFNEELRKSRALRNLKAMERGEPAHLNDYPSNQLIFWECEEKTTDYEYSFRKSGKVDPVLIALCKTIMRKHIKKVPLQYFDVIDAIYLFNKKKCLHNKVKTTNFESREVSNISMTSQFKFAIGQTTKTPDEVRTIAIPDHATRNTLYITRHNISKMLYHPFDSYYADPHKVTEELSKDGSFVLIDMKKFGWNVPKEILISVVECCKEVAPDYEPFDNLIEGLQNTQFLINDEFITTNRGGVLGMQDHLYSFFAACLFEAFIEHYDLVGVTAKFKGDDSYIYCEDQDLAYRVFKLWTKWLQRLDILINAKKSKVTQNAGLFCENYGYQPGEINVKVASMILNLYDCLKMNLFQAKCSISQALPALLSHGKIKTSSFDIKGMALTVVGDIISRLGWEFDPSEIGLPFEIGGWFRVTNEGNDALCWLENHDLHNINPGFLALSSFSLKPHRRCIVKQKRKFKQIINFEVLSDKNWKLLTEKLYMKPEKASWQTWRNLSEKRQLLFKNKKIDKYICMNTIFERSSGKMNLPLSFIDTTCYEDPISWIKNPVKLKPKVPKDPWVKLANVASIRQKLIEKTRASYLLEVLMGKPNLLCVKYDEEIPPCVLMISQERTAFKTNFMWPVNWYNWARNRDADIYQVQRSLVRLGLDITRCTPKINQDDYTPWFSGNSPTANLLCWDPTYLLPIRVDKTDLDYLLSKKMDIVSALKSLTEDIYSYAIYEGDMTQYWGNLIIPAQPEPDISQDLVIGTLPDGTRRLVTGMQDGKLVYEKAPVTEQVFDYDQSTAFEAVHEFNEGSDQISVSDSDSDDDELSGSDNEYERWARTQVVNEDDDDDPLM
jgi:hypothetical protein